MTTSPQKIFNPTALEKARQRSLRRQARKGVSFLYLRAAEDAASRLEDINRRFSRVVLIGNLDGRDLVKAALREDRQPEKFEYVADVSQLSGDYDLILSLLDLQSDDAIPDTLTHARQHLRADGMMLFAFLGGETLTELRQSLYATDQQILGGATARVFPMVDYSQAAMLLGRTGLALPVVDTDRINVGYSHLSNLIEDLRDLGLTNVLTARDTRPLNRTWLAALHANYAQHFGREDGKVKATLEIIWMTGWAPHESQQKPLKPGSAKMRLSDALGSKETKL
ncbi:SAM-dependent methyltransferase [Litorimonas cladophorae]|uniref:SAM-dependent methyltransferase n=1 Tax=Litorimonas cladophorae TaxID=1220491 RepID=A0A918NI66_9PROT|nr:SAM-dependent methyltransferase [Litorimonas cladophorae]GGX74947.1 SAM-dependent methyltransferase [Litorimonas cladophorae]